MFIYNMLKVLFLSLFITITTAFLSCNETISNENDGDNTTNTKFCECNNKTYNNYTNECAGNENNNLNCSSILVNHFYNSSLVEKYIKCRSLSCKLLHPMKEDLCYSYLLTQSPHTTTEEPTPITPTPTIITTRAPIKENVFLTSNSSKNNAGLKLIYSILFIIAVFNLFH